MAALHGPHTHPASSPEVRVAEHLWNMPPRCPQPMCSCLASPLPWTAGRSLCCQACSLPSAPRLLYGVVALNGKLIRSLSAQRPARPSMARSPQLELARRTASQTGSRTPGWPLPARTLPPAGGQPSKEHLRLLLTSPSPGMPAPWRAPSHLAFQGSAPTSLSAPVLPDAKKQE